MSIMNAVTLVTGNSKHKLGDVVFAWIVLDWSRGSLAANSQQHRKGSYVTVLLGL